MRVRSPPKCSTHVIRLDCCIPYSACLYPTIRVFSNPYLTPKTFLQGVAAGHPYGALGIDFADNFQGVLDVVAGAIFAQLRRTP